MSNKKDSFFQYVRAICILAVVLIHCSTVDGMPFADAAATYNLFARTLLAFPVATLFYLAGRFTKPIDDTKSYYAKRLVRLVIPYLVYSAGYIAFGMITGTKYTVEKLAIVLLTGQAATPFYYTICLIWMTLFTPILLKIIKKNYGLATLVSLTPILQMLAYVMLSRYDIGGYIKYTPVWISFYVTGIAKGAGIWKAKKELPISVHIFFCLMAYLISLLEKYILLNSTVLSSVAYSQWNFGAFLYAGALICLIERLSVYYRSEDVKLRSLASVGDNSYGIYNIHPLFISLCSALFVHLPITIPYPLNRYVMFVVSLVSSLLMINIIKLIIPKKWRQVLLGI